MNEVWKAIPLFNGEYFASNLGRIKSIKKWYNKNTDTYTTRIKVLSIGYNMKGYPIVQIYFNGRRETKPVHRLVASTFIPNPNNLPQVNHKDENKNNNKIENLEWCTNDYNAHYGTHIERVANSNKRRIYQYKKDGTFLRCYDSILDAAKAVGVSCGSHIGECAKGKIGINTVAGYVWKFN